MRGIPSGAISTPIWAPFGGPPERPAALSRRRGSRRPGRQPGGRGPCPPAHRAFDAVASAPVWHSSDRDDLELDQCDAIRELGLRS